MPSASAECRAGPAPIDTSLDYWTPARSREFPGHCRRRRAARVPLHFFRGGPGVRRTSFEKGENGHGQGQCGEKAIADHRGEVERLRLCKTAAVDVQVENVSPHDNREETDHDQAHEGRPNANLPADKK